MQGLRRLRGSRGPLIVEWTRSKCRYPRSVDDDEVPGEWLEAELSNDVTDNAWRQWFLPWDAPIGDHVLRVRATDGSGQTQTDLRTEPAPDGATGWHGVVVRIE